MVPKLGLEISFFKGEMTSELRHLWFGDVVLKRKHETDKHDTDRYVVAQDL